MYQEHHENMFEMQDLAELGNDVIAYMREITTEEIQEKFPMNDELQPGKTYWALFAADGTPLVLANDQQNVTAEAFHSDLTAILPN